MPTATKWDWRHEPTNATELIHDPFSTPYAIDRSGALRNREAGSVIESMSPSHRVDALASALLSSTASYSAGWAAYVPLIRARLELGDWVVPSLTGVWSNIDSVIGRLWTGLSHAEFAPQYGSPTKSDLALVARATGGGVISTEILPQYDDESD
jgi:hypothetical protein